MLRPADPHPDAILRRLALLAIPVFAEHALHVLVGITDTYLANNLVATQGLTGGALDTARTTNAAAGAAVGSVSYILWFIGLIVSAVGTGATAIEVGLPSGLVMPLVGSVPAAAPPIA